MAEQEDNQDHPIARRLVAAASLITDLIGKKVMVPPDSGRRQHEILDAEPNATSAEDPRCR